MPPFANIEEKKQYVKEMRPFLEALGQKIEENDRDLSTAADGAVSNGENEGQTQVYDQRAYDVKRKEISRKYTLPRFEGLSMLSRFMIAMVDGTDTEKAGRNNEQLYRVAQTYEGQKRILLEAARKYLDFDVSRYALGENNRETALYWGQHYPEIAPFFQVNDLIVCLNEVAGHEENKEQFLPIIEALQDKKAILEYGSFLTDCNLYYGSRLAQVLNVKPTDQVISDAYDKISKLVPGQHVSETLAALDGMQKVVDLEKTAYSDGIRSLKKKNYLGKEGIYYRAYTVKDGQRVKLTKDQAASIEQTNLGIPEERKEERVPLELERLSLEEEFRLRGALIGEEPQIDATGAFIADRFRVLERSRRYFCEGVQDPAYVEKFNRLFAAMQAVVNDDRAAIRTGDDGRLMKYEFTDNRRHLHEAAVTSAREFSAYLNTVGHPFSQRFTEVFKALQEDGRVRRERSGQCALPEMFGRAKQKSRDLNREDYLGQEDILRTALANFDVTRRDSPQYTAMRNALILAADKAHEMSEHPGDLNAALDYFNAFSDLKTKNQTYAEYKMHHMNIFSSRADLRFHTSCDLGRMLTPLSQRMVMNFRERGTIRQECARIARETAEIGRVNEQRNAQSVNHPENRIQGAAREENHVEAPRRVAVTAGPRLNGPGI